MARKPTKHPPKYWKNKCDKLWSQIIRKDGACAVCDQSDCQLHAHHLIRRDAIFFRHNLNCGIALCSQCHTFSKKFSAHGSPWKFEKWMKENRPEQFRWWNKNRWKTITGVTINYEQVYDVLKEAE